MKFTAPIPEHIAITSVKVPGELFLKFSAQSEQMIFPVLSTGYIEKQHFGVALSPLALHRMLKNVNLAQFPQLG